MKQASDFVPMSGGPPTLQTAVGRDAALAGADRFITSHDGGANPEERETASHEMCSIRGTMTMIHRHRPPNLQVFRQR